jgi:hypothetical protein
MDRITLVLDSKTLDYLANVLGQRPYAEVAPVLQNIAQQVQLQQAKGHGAPGEGARGAERRRGYRDLSESLIASWRAP